MTELGLELPEGLQQILLVLAPESAGLDLGRGLETREDVVSIGTVWL